MPSLLLTPAKNGPLKNFPSSRIFTGFSERNASTEPSVTSIEGTKGKGLTTQLYSLSYECMQGGF